MIGLPKTLLRALGFLVDNKQVALLSESLKEQLALTDPNTEAESAPILDHDLDMRPHRDLIAIGSLVTMTTPAIRRSLRTLPEQCSNHQMCLDAFRYATLDGESRGSLPQVRFLIRTLFFYFVTWS
jgi:hypothetical protein